jgi:hypothetical protein
VDYYVDTTASVTGYVNWAHVAPFEPERRAHPRSLQEKPVPTHISGAPDFFDTAKGLNAPTTKLSRSPAVGPYTPTPSAAREHNSSGPARIPVTEISEIDRIAKQRVRLMAARYASGAESSEMVARLEILNRRLLDKAPRVSVEQVQALEVAAGQLSQAQASREERMRRLGIKA